MNKEPALITAALVAIVNVLAIAFKLDPVLAAAISAAAIAVGALFVRSKVTPTG